MGRIRDSVSGQHYTNHVSGRHVLGPGAGFGIGEQIIGRAVAVLIKSGYILSPARRRL